MPRLARVVAVGVPHHITQRGNARRFILQDEADRKVYLDLLRQTTEQHGIVLIGYCLVSNHVHLVAVPRKADEETQGRTECNLCSYLCRRCEGPVCSLHLSSPDLPSILRTDRSSERSASL
jgi:REP element-mobilizing transposase RayT